jgi:hypothetical protein
MPRTKTPLKKQNPIDDILPPGEQRIDNKIWIEFDNDLTPGERLNILNQINKVIEYETSYKLKPSTNVYDLKYRHPNIFNSSGGTYAGPIAQ